jgi:hypothetical protein
MMGDGRRTSHRVIAIRAQVWVAHVLVLQSHNLCDGLGSGYGRAIPEVSIGRC